MATVATGSGVYINSGGLWAFTIVDFLRSNTNWTVAGSGNGTDGGMGMDVITSASDLTNISGRWVVLENPSGQPQIMLSRYSTADGNFLFTISPSGVFTGGNASTPATASDQVSAFQTTCYSAGRMHITAEYDGYDLVDSGFAVFIANLNTRGSSGAVAFLPLVNTYPNDGYQWILYNATSSQGYAATNLSYDAALITASGSRGIDSTDQTTLVAYGAGQIAVETGSGKFNNIPLGTGISYEDNLSFPIMFLRATLSTTNVGYKGITTYMQWNSVERAVLTTWNNKTRISFGDVNFPWDGTSSPILG